MMTMDDRHAAFLAGYDLGKSERVTEEIEERVLARLHDQALQALGMARRLAAVKGPSWSAMVTDEFE
jgi:hypothetical protein